MTRLVSPLPHTNSLLSMQFLEGANSMDDHFRTAPLGSNLPVLMGLTSVWNISFLGFPARAILPYCQVRRGRGVVCLPALVGGGGGGVGGVCVLPASIQGGLRKVLGVGGGGRRGGWGW
jgi:hypothetical protein